MKIRHIMSRKTITLKKSDTAKKAIKILSRNRISGCPVVDSKNNILGIVTQSDIVELIDVFSGIKSGDFFSLVESVIKGNENAGFAKIQDKKISEFIQGGVVTIEKEENISAAAKLMNRHKIDRLPVVEGNRLVGIVTKSDIVDALGTMKK